MFSKEALVAAATTAVLVAVVLAIRDNTKSGTFKISK